MWPIRTRRCGGCKQGSPGQGQASKWSRRVRIVLFACALLGLVAAAVFWLLNIQPGVFTTLFGASGVIIGLMALIEAMLAVLTNVTKERALITLGNLLEQHLVQSQSVTGHYLLHPIVASYASRHFVLDESASGESARKAAYARAAHYYMQVAAANNATPSEIKKHFAVLLAQVEREGMERVVERALREMLSDRDRGHV